MAKVPVWLAWRWPIAMQQSRFFDVDTDIQRSITLIHTDGKRCNDVTVSRDWPTEHSWLHRDIQQWL